MFVPGRLNTTSCEPVSDFSTRFACTGPIVTLSPLSRCPYPLCGPFTQLALIFLATVVGPSAPLSFGLVDAAQGRAVSILPISIKAMESQRGQQNQEVFRILYLLPSLLTIPARVVRSGNRLPRTMTANRSRGRAGRRAGARRMRRWRTNRKTETFYTKTRCFTGE